MSRLPGRYPWHCPQLHGQARQVHQPAGARSRPASKTAPFERCRFEEFFSHSAEFVRCRFVGRVKMAVMAPTSGRRNEIVDNDFSKAELSANIGLRGDFPVHLQRWPDGFVPGTEPRLQR
jgi:hypothetical protein